MKITSVTVKLVEDKTKPLLACASVVFDNEFVVHDVKIINGEKGLFLSFPAKKNKYSNEFYDIAHPLNANSRQYIQDEVIKAYNEEIAKKSN